MSNSIFSKKKEYLKNSHIELNRWVADQDDWQDDRIKARADVLLERANQIWMSPLSGRGAN